MRQDTKKIILDWQEEVAGSLVEGFRQLFESSSHVLLEFGDAAENNRLQSLFFDAQREFYLKEEPIIAEFERRLRDSLSTFAGNSGQPTQLGADTLSLVDVDEYERSLALETIAKRTMNRHLGELHGLAQRLSALLGGRPMSIEMVPANPLQIIRIFDPASRMLEVEKEVRLVFYTLFDRYVMSRLAELYREFNQRLIDIGILPNIKFEYQRFGRSDSGGGTTDGPTDPSAARHEPDGPAAGGAGDAAGADTRIRLRPPTPSAAETLSAISSLLMEKRKRQQATPRPATSTPIVPSAANVGEAIADARVLQEAPHPLPLPTGATTTKVAIDATLLVKVRHALEKQRQIIKNLVGQERLDSREEDVIDIVGMLFEAMLNEKLLANSVKTLLSHLHTRYLKIAVQNPSFLDDTGHPARQLFEKMLDAGIRWVREDNLRAGIYPHLQQLVTLILRDESLQEAFFLEQIHGLEQAEKRLEMQSNVAEERTLEAERGRARLEQAKKIVRQTIDDISGDNEVAPAVVGFLSTTYADYLTLLLLRSDLDTQSASWSTAYSVGEALVAAAVYAAGGQPLDSETRSELTARLQNTVCSLIPHHEQNIRQVVAALQMVPAQTVTVNSGSAPAPPAAIAAAAAEADASIEDQRVADKLMREAGNWFVMRADPADDGEERVVKLLWVNPHTRNMLFVDQHGAKVALMPAISVASKIREGEIRPMEQETSSFVARSLRRIRRALEDSVTG